MQVFVAVGGKRATGAIEFSRLAGQKKTRRDRDRGG
jgi:hypothetical protein